MAGLLDQFGEFLNTPGGMGLLSAVGAGLAGARRGAPMNSIGAGLLGGLQGYSQAQDFQQQQKFQDQRGKLFDAQMQDFQAQADLRKADAAKRQTQLSYLSQLQGGGQAPAPQLGTTPAFGAPVSSGFGMVDTPQLTQSIANEQSQPSGIGGKADPRKMLEMGFDPKFVEAYMGADNLGRPKGTRTVEGKDAQGNKVTYLLDDYGQRVGDGIAGYTAPERVDLGGRTVFVTPQAGLSLTKTMTPGEIAANARAREAAARDALSVTYQQDAEGNFVALPTKVQPGSMVRGLPVVSGPGMSPLKGAQKDAKLTEAEGKATLYLGQMRSAANTLNQLQASGKTAEPWQVAMTGSVGGNVLTSSNAQQIGQAQDQWSEAYLRQKTGAAATKDEIKLNNRTFFPQIGDSPEVIKQKASMRAQVEQGMEIPAGRGVSKLGGAPAGGPKFLGFE